MMLACPPVAPVKFVGKTTKSLAQLGAAVTSNENLAGNTGYQFTPLSGTPVVPPFPNDSPQSLSTGSSRCGGRQSKPENPNLHRSNSDSAGTRALPLRRRIW